MLCLIKLLAFRKENMEFRRHDENTFNGTVSRVIEQKLEGLFVSLFCGQVWGMLSSIQLAQI